MFRESRILTDCVLVQFQTPKALANFSPGLERSDNPGGYQWRIDGTLKGLGIWRTPFRVKCEF